MREEKVKVFIAMKAYGLSRGIFCKADWLGTKVSPGKEEGRLETKSLSLSLFVRERGREKKRLTTDNCIKWGHSLLTEWESRQKKTVTARITQIPMNTPEDSFYDATHALNLARNTHTIIFTVKRISLLCPRNGLSKKNTQINIKVVKKRMGEKTFNFCNISWSNFNQWTKRNIFPWGKEADVYLFVDYSLQKKEKKL